MTDPAVPGEAARPAAVLWDMDGTLVDTEPYWIDTEFEIAERHGGTWSRAHALNLVGNDLLESGRYIREHMGIDLPPEHIVEELLDGVVARVEQEVPWRPGAVEMLAALTAAGTPCGLVTMSYERFVAPILSQLPPETFRVIVTGDKVEFGKPHPEPYLTAAAALGVAPADCLAIEDSNTGAKSAESAGCLVLVVENHVPVLATQRRIFRDSLVDLDVGEVWAEQG
ncbi:HAD-IA family hydrolase [Nocardioides sp. MAH-18]|uniref:HAD-IA family hydrolase n=1 Tax=Nocardioides agri TaxID=2682843 RepID=A0A6L6XYW6_9ACTN|nr:MULTISPECIES: HAD family phosphatase [unclassified Nocardioides]MBA2952761.1 HAD family phosphatase [Nocardioides sp. CGMCC 1.13656]MVQ51923.1 HAD-IA family hydrolase [Nocardioides sp. MAH-18]